MGWWERQFSGHSSAPARPSATWVVVWADGQLMFAAPTKLECEQFLNKYSIKDQVKMRIFSSGK